MKLTASLVITLVLVIVLSSCPTPTESRRGPAAVRKRHVVQKRLTAEDVLGNMHTQQSEVLNAENSANQCLDSKCAKLNIIIMLTLLFYKMTS